MELKNMKSTELSKRTNSKYWKKYIGIITILTIIAITVILRVYGLDKWSLHHDENWTLLQFQDLFGGNPTTEPYIAKAMPLTFCLLYPSVVILGPTHVGLRLGAMLCGIGSIVFILILGWRAFGVRFGVIAACLVGFAPWHIYLSQYARFYAPAFLFLSIFIFSLIIALNENKSTWIILAAMSGSASVYSHTYSLLPLFSGVGFVLLLWLWPKVRPPEWRRKTILLYFTLTGIILVPIIIVILSVAGSSTQSTSWMYTPMHTFLGLLNNLNLPIVGMAVIGSIFAVCERDWKSTILVIVASIPAILIVGVSHIVSARHTYYFPSSVAIYALVAYAIDKWGGRYKFDRVILTLLIILLQAPNIFSYYSSGNRFEHERAANFINKQKTSQDILVTNRPGLSRYYDIGDLQRLRWLEFVEGEIPYQAKRAWIVVEISRKGLSMSKSQWLNKNAVLQWESRPTRYDYFDQKLQVWLWERKINI